MAIPRPSASVLLVAPGNHVLLLQRVQQSSSFPSAHVFPGGNLSAFHEGPSPKPGTAGAYRDGESFRRAAIRETFEESGILLARDRKRGSLLQLSEVERDSARKEIHSDRIAFSTWLDKLDARPDIEGLIPFTRWLTPKNMPKRFSTQMYLYFLQSNVSDKKEVIPVPTTDGGLEHVTARFLPAKTWLNMARLGEIILFPPQFLLLHCLAQHPSREELMEFIRSGSPPWGEKCISPLAKRKHPDGRVELALDRPGPEVEALDLGMSGVEDISILVEFHKEGPRRLELITRDSKA
ncbi:hypothetical protein K470DRAFT_219230 [Piedraia hortae CBS 480.64]|uniref:Nudix hydrolase domain-containing protein n=1 Tax=Piedraia hortae CBS 480.64 TaxID=1314780 RepID=A0A6A7BXE1_9PEZI|nr:hypothetical protein K470DRAFT_219230 [Piedraia hortae CBS 480.64]